MGLGKNLLKAASEAFIGKGIIDPSSYHGGITGSSGSQVTYQIRESFLDYVFGSNRAYKTYTKAFRNSPLVFMVVNKIAKTSASIKRVYKNENGEIIENSKIEQLLKTPKKGQSRIEFLREIGESVGSAGNSFTYFVKGVGAGVELIVWRPGYVDIKTNSVGKVIGYWYTEVNGDVTKVDDPELVLHIKESTISQDTEVTQHFGVSPLEAMWIVVQSSNEKFNAEASIFKNRGIIGILTNETDIPMQPNERDELQGEFDKEVGGADRFNKIKISSTKLKYIQTGMSPTDLKLLEGIVSSLRLICAAYCMPSVIFNDTDQSTYNNMVEAKKSAYTDAYLPLCDMIDSKLSVWLSKHLGVNETMECDLTSIEELRNTTNEVMQAINALEPRVAVRVLEAMTINNILEMVGLDEIGEEGNERLAKGAQNTTQNEE